MATHGRRPDRPLTRQLREEPTRFDFYQLVRLLLRERGGDGGDLGEALDAAVRFRANLELGFPGHEVRVLREPAGSAGPVEVETGNYALAGYLGPLPSVLFERMLDRMRDEQPVMARFLDLFNHRINVLRYRLKAAPRLGLNSAPPERTAMADMLAASMGMAAPGLAEQIDQLGLPRRGWLSLAGLLANPRHSAPVLTRVLGRFVGAPVELESLVGAWRERPEVDLTALAGKPAGAAPAHDEPAAAQPAGGLGRTVLGQPLVSRAPQPLGRSARLGGRVWMQAARVRLTFGPLDYARYCRLLPKPRSNASDAYPQLAGLLRFLLQRRQDAWVHLRLKAGEAPPALLTARERRIDRTGEVPGGIYYGLRLGQTAWLAGDRTREREACFLVAAFEEQAA